MLLAGDPSELLLHRIVSNGGEGEGEKEGEGGVVERYSTSSR